MTVKISQSHFKIFYGIASFLLSMCSYSQTLPGFYVGGLIGFGSVDYGNYTFLPAHQPPSSIDDAGFAPALQIGYRFSSLFHVEMGAIYFRKVIFNQISPQNDARFKNNIVYFTGKINFFYYRSFNFFFKGGLGYVVRNAVIVDNVTIISGEGILRPVYGVGTHWRLTTTWDLEMMWMQAAQEASQQLPASNFIGIGVHYNL